MGAPKSYNKYQDRKDLKTRDIKKSLVHKARLRKNYFKLLEKEGVSVPEKKQQQDQQQQHTEDNKRLHLTYQEKSKINKERRVELKKLSLEKQRAKLKLIEQAQAKRDVRREKFSQKTKNGQPLMGPRISDLLTKIKQDSI